MQVEDLTSETTALHTENERLQDMVQSHEKHMAELTHTLGMLNRERVEEAARKVEHAELGALDLHATGVHGLLPMAAVWAQGRGGLYLV